MTAHITIRLFATLNKFTPASADQYPIRPGITVSDVLDELDIPKTEAKLIFINSMKCGMASVLKDGDRLGVFPPLGGG
jgi:molybdopterin converting factor small subunit